jgi:hypothetical protein
MRRTLLGVLAAAAAVAALAVLPVGAGAQLAGGRPGCSLKAQKNRGNLRAALHVKWDGHHPHHWRRIRDRDRRIRAWDAIWPITVTARHNGRGITGGKMYYQFIFSGRIVACRTVLKPYSPHFRRGVARDRIEWPERAINVPLTFRVVVKTKYGTRNLNYKVRVRPRKKH